MAGEVELTAEATSTPVSIRVIIAGGGRSVATSASAVVRSEPAARRHVERSICPARLKRCISWNRIPVASSSSASARRNKLSASKRKASAPLPPEPPELTSPNPPRPPKPPLLPTAMSVAFGDEGS